MKRDQASRTKRQPAAMWTAKAVRRRSRFSAPRPRSRWPTSVPWKSEIVASPARAARCPGAGPRWSGARPASRPACCSFWAATVACRPGGALRARGLAITSARAALRRPAARAGVAAQMSLGQRRLGRRARAAPAPRRPNTSVTALSSLPKPRPGRAHVVGHDHVAALLGQLGPGPRDQRVAGAAGLGGEARPGAGAARVRRGPSSASRSGLATSGRRRGGRRPARGARACPPRALGGTEVRHRRRHHHHVGARPPPRSGRPACRARSRRRCAGAPPPPASPARPGPRSG